MRSSYSGACIEVSISLGCGHGLRLLSLGRSLPVSGGSLGVLKTLSPRINRIRVDDP